MGKTKSTQTPEMTPTAAPYIYVNDPTAGGLVVTKLIQLIPKTHQISLKDLLKYAKEKPLRLLKSHAADIVPVFTSPMSNTNEAEKKIVSDLVRNVATLRGRNYASINLYEEGGVPLTTYGTNHLNLSLTKSSTEQEAQSIAEKLYKWLFTVLTVKDTLHLIPDDEMRQIDQKTAVAGHSYCQLANRTKVGKDKKLIFVVLILTKPAVVREREIRWQVADKSGATSFYFKWRSEACQATWDWVLKLEPGQRKTLPAMSQVLVKEKVHISIMKLPLRIPGTIIQGVGEGIKAVGTGISGVGKKMKMGPRKKWVMEADLSAFVAKHKNYSAVIPVRPKVTIPIFTAKGERAWSDSDSGHSTLKEEPINEKKVDERDDVST